MLTLWEPLMSNRMSNKSFVDKLFADSLKDWFEYPSYNAKHMFGIESKKNEDGTISVSIDLPGIEQENLSIEVQDGLLSIKGERKTAVSSYSLNKSFSIPEGIDANNISAELKNGVLNLTFVQKQMTGSEIKKIPIKT